MSKEMRGYKVFKADWSCRDKVYSCPGRFQEKDRELSLCEYGMHFCINAADCFNYYDFDKDYHAAEVIAHGNVLKEGDKCCTDDLEIVHEIPRDELLRMINTGDYNTGYHNTGNCNTGNRNTGNYNTGNCNTGNRNTGNYNTGYCNTGNRNTGNRNTGNYNTGNYNTGNRNTGDYNTGYCNAGDYNTGDYNTGDCNTGYFNTKTRKIFLFDKESDWTCSDWLNSNAYRIISSMQKDVVEWICSGKMTEEEKAAHPEHETTGGYLKILDESECAQTWWDGLDESEKDTIRSIPNYDKGIFEEIMGIKTE